MSQHAAENVLTDLRQARAGVSTASDAGIVPDTVQLLELLAKYASLATMLAAIKLAGNEHSPELVVHTGFQGSAGILDKDAVYAVVVNRDVMPSLEGKCSDVLALDHFLRFDSTAPGMGVLLLMVLDPYDLAHLLASVIVSSKSAIIMAAVLTEVRKAVDAHGIEWAPTKLLHDLCLADTKGVQAVLPSVKNNIHCHWHRCAAAYRIVGRLVTHLVVVPLIAADRASLTRPPWLCSATPCTCLSSPCGRWRTRTRWLPPLLRCWSTAFTALNYAHGCEARCTTICPSH